ncbi:unnamed protein product [Malus baccata var. baccata]|uniref:Uncharacterized protein n=1 Tax=Malus baccata TaxID=106549 RepID=A0A540N0P8_MALBA|nr:uncharacterized protein LOC103439886 [Malus domestica]XP_050156583.1 uncharacterized protein LOC126630500 [Malus sylvestris]TQE04637.1 hypothetical protein C1H46_009720 [Malus baccata]
MAFRINGFLLLQVLYLSALLIIPLSSGIVTEGFKDGMDPINLFHKNDVEIISRKLRRLHATMQDYDDTGSNPRHDPRKRTGNGRNP